MLVAVDLPRNRARMPDGIVVKLSPQESEMLSLLAEAPGNVAMTESLIRRIWGARDEPQYAAARVRKIVSRLRKRIAGHGVKIESYWGRGYELTAS